MILLLVTKLIIILMSFPRIIAIYPCNAPWCDPSHEPYPNIASVMTGYHIMKGNPFISGRTHDPGFATAYIFVPTYKTPQHRYALHSGITVRQTLRCSLSLNTDTVTTVEGYKENIGKQITEGSTLTSNLETEVSSEISGVGIKTKIPPILDAAFSSSKEYKDNENFFTKKQGVLTFNDATCSTYTTDISIYNPPPFSNGFVNAIKILQLTTNQPKGERERQFNIFIEHYGTHYIHRATMGARTAISRRYSRTEYKKAKDSAIKKCNSDRLSINILGFGGSKSSASCKAVANTANSAKVEGYTREYTTTYGSKPAKSLYAWSQQKFTAPLPIKMKLSPILNLFTSAHMKRYGIDYKRILRWIAPLYYRYCENHKRLLRVKSCNPEKHRGCGWNDNCSPRIQTCLNWRWKPNGYYCCTPKCNSLPCRNGGRCRNILSRCDYHCTCKKSYMGKTCNVRYIDSGIIKTEVLRKMAVYRSESNDKFKNTLLRYLSSTYPRYYFTVNSYGQAYGYHSHTMSGHCAIIFRQYGRNVVACWSRKNARFPSYCKQQQIKRGVVKALYNGGCHASSSYRIAKRKARSYGYPLSLVMIVRHGNGLRTTWIGNTVFANFVCRRKCKTVWWRRKCYSHKSSVVIMFG